MALLPRLPLIPLSHQVPLRRLEPPLVAVGWLVALFCCGQVMLWGLSFAMSYSAPEIDSAEQFVWAFSMENGYWKHPPLPSWIMHGLLAVFGPSVALPFVATQVAIVIALALMWRLGCEWMSPQRSLVAMALTSLVTYHNLGGDCFNHNTALLPFQAATVLSFYLATRRGHWALWALTGLAAGLSMLVKYVALFPILALLLYFISERGLHHRRPVLGLLLATAVFCAVLVPHAIWLQQTDFLPFRYAQSVAQSLPGFVASAHGVFSFVLIQATRLIPFVAALIFLRWHSRSGRRLGTSPSVEATAHHAVDSGAAGRFTASDRRFLVLCALVPIVAPVVFGVATQTELQARWGANGFLLIGWLVLAGRQSIAADVQRRALLFVCAVHLVLCLGMTLSKTVVADYLQIRTRANFPGALLAKNAQATWREHTAAPLRLVVSDIWLGGNIIANSRQRVAVMIDGRHLKSPWVRDSAVEECGALVLDDLTDDKRVPTQPQPAIEALMARADAKGEWALPWADSAQLLGREQRGRVRWGIIVPRRPWACALR